MSDYTELQLGHRLLVQFFTEESNKKCFYSALNTYCEGVAEEAIHQFDQWWQNNICFNTYIACVSEHDDTEDVHGRLSMWRAFGGVAARAAIVFKAPAPGDAEGLRVFLSPVAYFGYGKVRDQIRAVIANIQANRDFLHSLGRDRIRDSVFRMLVMAAVSLKHEGFAEEREWRLVYFPHLDPSPMILQSIETIEGIPQIVCKIPLNDNPEGHTVGIEISALIDRVIIGPTTYPIAIYGAFVAALHSAGVTDPASRVVISGIPLRP